MRNLALIAVCLVFLTGCRSTTITKEVKKEYDPKSGAYLVCETVKEVEESKTPLVDKWVFVTCWGYGFKIILFDPQTGSFAPCIEAIGGRTGLSTMPVVGEDSNTYCESLYVEKSMWSNAASVVEVNRVASGNMKDVKPMITIKMDLAPNAASGTSIIENMPGLAPDKLIKK